MPLKLVENINFGPDVRSGKNFFSLWPWNSHRQFCRTLEL